MREKEKTEGERVLRENLSSLVNMIQRIFLFLSLLELSLPEEV